jgi:hypothetical protein
VHAEEARIEQADILEQARARTKAGSLRVAGSKESSSSPSEKREIETIPCRWFSQKAAIERAPGKRPLMPTMAIASLAPPGCPRQILVHVIHASPPCFFS